MAENGVGENKIVLYRGKRIEDMSREELIEALNFAANEIQRLMEEKQHERDFIFSTFIRPTQRVPDAGDSGENN